MKSKNLEHYINTKIQGQEIWAIVSGYGSFIYINIGKKIQYKNLIKNNSLPEFIRDYKAEFVFNIWSSWRLIKDKKIVKSSKTVIELDEELLQMAGRSIRQITISNVSDLNIQLESGELLSVFNDEDEDVCWGFVEANKMYSVKPYNIEIVDYEL